MCTTYQRKSTHIIGPLKRVTMKLILHTQIAQPCSTTTYALVNVPNNGYISTTVSYLYTS